MAESPRTSCQVAADPRCAFPSFRRLRKRARTACTRCGVAAADVRGAELLRPIYAVFSTSLRPPPLGAGSFVLLLGFVVLFVLVLFGLLRVFGDWVAGTKEAG